MTDEQNLSMEDTSESQIELAHQQALRYGKDLARVYVAEKAKRQKLEVAYQALDAVFASTPDGLVVLDNSLVIQQANAAFAQLTETTVKAVIGQSIQHVLLSDQLYAALQNLAGDPTVPTQLELNVKQPIKRSLLANIARLQAGGVQGWVIVLHDESKRKRLEQQKIEFINIAAHELRTPLISIMGFAELLLEDSSKHPEQADESREQYLEAIIRGSARLSNIIRELLQFAEFNRGDSSPGGISQFKLSDLVTELVSELQERADKKRITFEIALPDSDIQMFANRALLRTALYQLILNGINFNVTEGVVRLEVFQKDEQIVINVIDSGIGIAQTDIDSIFSPFFQVEHPDTRSVGGLGLGLSIAKHAVAELAGILSVDSSIGQGTTFHLQLPIRQPSSETAEVDLRAQLELSHQASTRLCARYANSLPTTSAETPRVTRR